MSQMFCNLCQNKHVQVNFWSDNSIECLNTVFQLLQAAFVTLADYPVLRVARFLTHLH